MLGHVFLGRYEACGSLGSGAMGQVFLARDIHNPREVVVVKVMHDHIAQQPEFRQLFRSELKNMARFRHPYAVRLFDGSVDDPNGPCIVMEYIPGKSLEHVLRLDKWLSIERVAGLLGPLCHAMAAAHDAGVIHRDLKPANLMVTNPGDTIESLKVMDLGLAMFAAQPYIPLEVLTGHGPGQLVGTPAYMPPEQIRGDEVDERGDIYSIGVTLFEMLTGVLPFPIPDTKAMLEAHLSEPPPTFREIRPDLDIPPDAEQVVLLCLAKFPNERPRSAEVLARWFGDAIGLDIWAACEPDPVALAGSQAELDIRPAVNSSWAVPPDLNAVTHEIIAWMPERIAVIKLRGFVEDQGGMVLESKPGRIRVMIGGEPQLASPAHDTRLKGLLTGSGGVLGWIGRLTMSPPPPPPPAAEPVMIDLKMEKPDPRANQLKVTARYCPLGGGSPSSQAGWQARCDRLHNVLRAYLIGG